MILMVLLLVLLLGGLLAWGLERYGKNLPRWISLFALGIGLAISLSLWSRFLNSVKIPPDEKWIVELAWNWVPQFGISFHLGLDGLSLLMLLLTFFLGILSVLASWTEIRERVGFFHFNVMWTLAGIAGVFLALDLFLFYFFWELMLVPMVLLIAIWGHENRLYAAIKFFIFTQASGLLMLLSILGLTYIYYLNSGTLTFDYPKLLGMSLAPSTAMWLMLGFFIAFAVKLPAIPLHTWLPDAHTEAPTAGSVILAGLLLKTGAYGILRFAIPLFPQAAINFTPVAMALGAAGVLYGAVLAFSQNDLKRLVAYTSVSHLGFVLMGAFAGNPLALQGTVMQMICHGFSTGALFILVGALQERTHTRDLRQLGGLWTTAPRMGGMALFFAMASLGLPGLGNFVAEFLILLGSFERNIPLTVLASVGLIGATVYSLSLIQDCFHGSNRGSWKVTDLSIREAIGLSALVLSLIWLGVYPQAVLATADPVLRGLQQAIGG